MRYSRLFVSLTPICLIAAAIVPGGAGSVSAGGMQVAQSNFERTFRSTDVTAEEFDPARFDRAKVERDRERRIKAQGREPGRVSPLRIVKRLTGKVRVPRHEDAAAPPSGLIMFASGIPGSTTMSIGWTPGGPSGCRVELRRPSDGALVASRESTSGACDRAFFDSFLGDGIVPGGEYNVRIQNYDGTWSPATEFLGVDTTTLSGLRDFSIWGNCICGTSLGRSQQSQNLVGDPINTANGSFLASAQDAKMPAPGVALDLTRSYSSADSTGGLLGKGWTFPYEASLKVETSKVTYRAEDGQQAEYVKNTDGTFATPPSVTSKLAAVSGGYRLTTKAKTSLSFDTAGRLTSSKDGSGQGLTFGYTVGVLSSITDAGGRLVAVQVTGGKVTKVTLPDGRFIQYTYTGDLLTSVRDMRGGTTAYEYDAGNRLTKVKDQLNRYVTQNTYNATTGRITQQIDARGKISTYGWDPATGKATRRDPRGGIWTDYYRGGMLMQSIDPLGNITDYTYNAKLQRVAVTDPNSRVTKMAYDTVGNLLNTTSPAPLNYFESWKYDAADNMIEHFNKRGKVTKYAYDTANRLTKTTDPALGETIYTYTAKGQLETEKTPLGKITSYTYDAAGNRLTKRTPLGHTTAFTYDGTGRKLTETDPRGTATPVAGDFTTTFGYDAVDHVTSVKDARGNTTRSEYNQVGDLLNEIDAFDKVTRNTYSAAHLILTRTEPGLPAEVYAYDDNANLTRVTDPAGAATVSGYDAANRRTSMVTARGVETSTPGDFTWTYAYDPAGNQTQVTDPTGAVTKTKYDEVNRPVEVTDPLNHVTKTAYDQVDNITRVTNAVNHFTQSTYDDLGRVATTIDARTNVTTHSYDADSNLISVTTPLGFITKYGYDDDGHKTTLVDARGNVTGADPSLYTSRYGYDAAGNQTTVTDQLGKVTTTDYDAVDNVVSVTDALTHTTASEYDVKNRLTKVTAADGGFTAYGYDDVDNLVRRTDPRSKVTTYGYDAKGRVLEIVDPLGRKITHAYDPEGNLKTTVKARGNVTGADPAPWTITAGYDPRGLQTSIGSPDTQVAATFKYDAAGRHTSSLLGTGQERVFGYDNADRLTSVARGSEQFAYSYDNDGRVTSRTYPDSSVITAVFDKDGRQTSSTRAGQAATFTYDQIDNLTRLTYPAGTGYSEGRNYDRASRLIAVASSKAGVGLSRYDVIRDPVGNPTRVKATRSSVITDESYLYDPNDRLAKVCYTPACDDTATTYLGYTYDKSGNRLTETRTGVPNPGTTTNLYDDADQLTTSTKAGATTNYTYDADGNPRTAGTATYTYDASNRLRAKVQGGTTVTAAYDPDGHRWSIATTGQTTKALAWDLNNDLPMLAVHTQSTTRTAIRYTDTGIPIEAAAGPTTSTPNDYAWLLHDHMGSTVDTITDTGTPETKSTYEPFGAATRTKLDPAALDTLLGFTGERHDPNLGLTHLRARDYDPTQGRFLSTDPLAPAIDDPFVAGYVYAANQPTVFTDPSGRSIIDDYLAIMEALWIAGGASRGAAAAAVNDVRLGMAASSADQAADLADFFGADTSNLNLRDTAAALRAQCFYPGAFGLGYQLGFPYPGVAGVRGPGRGLIYVPNPKHGKVQRGRIGAEPTNPRTALDSSITFSENSASRIGVDPKTGEIVVFRQSEGGDAPTQFHGYVVPWGELSQAQQAALRKAGLVTKKGKIVE